MDLKGDAQEDPIEQADERWPEVRRLLDEVLDLERDARAAYLDRHCADAALRAEVEDYLAREDDVATFIETPFSRLLAERPPERREGQRVGAYQLARQIGQGGMGVVYEAHRVDDAYRQRVAVKVLKRGLDTEEISARFQRERQILAHLAHAHIARILDGGSTDDGLPYFVMELVAGTPVDRYCREQKLDLEERLELFRQVCETVHFAHQNLVVHCDLKPANILVTERGVPKLLDFGVAKLLRRHEADVTVTRLPWRPGTPPYTSPEQARGQAVTTASDVYSLGVVLYELLTGEPLSRDPASSTPSPAPYGERPLPRPSTAVRARLGEDGDAAAIRRRRQLARRLRGDLDTIVSKAVHPEAERRYASAAALAEDVRRHLVHEPISARPDSFLYRAGRLVRRRPFEAAVSAVALAAVLSLVVLLAVQLDRTEAQRVRATVLRDSFLEMLETVDFSNRQVSSAVAVDVAEAALGQEHSLDVGDRAQLLERTGMVYYRFGLLTEAQRLLEKALDLRRREDDADPTRIAALLNNLGVVFLSLGRFAEAEQRLQESLEVNPTSDPEQRSTALKTMTSQASALSKAGNLPAAERLYRWLLDQRRELHGESSPDYATGLNMLAAVLTRQNKLDEAEPLLRRTLELRRALLGPEHPKVAKSLMNHAALLDARGESGAAAAAYREALAIRRQHFTDDHPDVARVWAGLAFSLLGSGEPGKLAEAEALLQRALDVHLAERGADHPDTLVIQRNLGATRLARGEAAEAETILREVLERSPAVLEPGHWRLADARSVLGHCLIVQGRYGEAEKLVVESYPVIRDVKGESSRYAREARQRIVELYMGWGREGEAEPYRVTASSED